MSNLRSQVAIAVVCTFVALGALAWAFTQQNRLFDQLARCIIEQSAESRQVNRAAHNDLLRWHGLEPPPDELFPPPIPVDESRCDRFVKQRGQVVP